MNLSEISPENAPVFLTKIGTVVQQAIDQHRLVGVVVLVAKNGQLIHCQAAGQADRENSKPMTTNMQFRLASVSKVIVSVAALKLIAANKLYLDADIQQFLPNFQAILSDGTKAKITVRQLLSHTAGLGYRFFEADASSPYAQAGVSDGMDASNISLEENLRRIATVPLLYSPGTAWGYSLATDVLGALIENVTGKPLSLAVQDLVTVPLAMTDTSFSVHDTKRMSVAYVNDTPQPHVLKENEIVSPFEGCIGIQYSPARIFNPDAFASGGAGMAGTAADFLYLLETLRKADNSFLPASLIAEMGTDQATEFGLVNSPGFGFGLGSSVLRNPTLAQTPESIGTWRWGGAYGHSWFVDHERELSVVAFSNTLYEGMSGRFVTDLRDSIYSAIAGESA